MLWLALHFPRLPLEALACGSSPSAGASPRAVVGGGRVIVADAVAERGGVVPGLRLSSALGIVPDLAAFERNPEREAATLRALACWSGRFTPQLSLAAPAALLLEIEGCQRLFGSAAHLLQQTLDGCRSQGFSAAAAVAPTPLGALWLARAGRETVCSDDAALRRELGALAPDVTGWTELVLHRLRTFGMRRLGDLAALPRSALAQRLGTEVVADLARAWGELHDPRPSFVFPETFRQTLEFPSRVEVAEGLLFGARRLFAALAGWLAARVAGVLELRLEMEHDDRSRSTLELRLAEAARDEARLARLLRERLARLQLKAPVQALSLVVDEVLSLAGETPALFGGGENVRESAVACLERLRARLGDDRVFALRRVDDYRPECATAPAELDGAPPPMAKPAEAARQPFWLLRRPQKLSEIRGQPQWHGPLRLVRGPERLESGWWDEGESGAAGDIRRDYFMAEDAEGRSVWVFRNAEGWYVHGVFG